jgi:hypothetical protein
VKLKAATKKRTVKVWCEPENGFWADLKPGLRCIAADTHTCHEDTLDQLEMAVAWAEPCRCDDCGANCSGAGLAAWPPGR